VEVRDRPTDGNRFPTSTHLQNRVKTRQEADVIVTATTSSTASTRLGTMRRSHVQPSGSSRPYFTVARHARSAGALFNRALPASVDLSPRPIASIPKSYSPLNERYSRVARSPSAKGELPLLAPSMPQSIDAMTSLNDSNLNPLSGATPTLTDITFRRHFAHCYSFTTTTLGTVAMGEESLSPSWLGSILDGHWFCRPH
jgi:hypothetical protein